jgi:hypothetical protein
MPEEFKLTSPDSQPGPDLDTLQRSEKLLGRLKELAARRRGRRQVLVTWSFRAEPALMKNLKRLSSVHPDLSQTDIVHGLLEIMVPLLSAGREDLRLQPSIRPMELQGIPQEQLAGLLSNMLVSMLQAGGTAKP